MPQGGQHVHGGLRGFAVVHPRAANAQVLFQVGHDAGEAPALQLEDQRVHADRVMAEDAGVGLDDLVGVEGVWLFGWDEGEVLMRLYERLLHPLQRLEVVRFGVAGGGDHDGDGALGRSLGEGQDPCSPPRGAVQEAGLLQFRQGAGDVAPTG